MKIRFRQVLPALLQPAFFGALPVPLFVVFRAFLPGWLLPVWLLWLAALFAVWFRTRPCADAATAAHRTWSLWRALGNLLRPAALLPLTYALGLMGSLAWWTSGGGLRLEEIYRYFGSCCSGTHALELSPELFGPMAAVIPIYWLYRRHTWRGLTGFAAVAALVIAWLVWDEPLAVDLLSLEAKEHTVKPRDVALDGRNVHRPPRGKSPLPFQPQHDLREWRPHVVSQADVIRTEWIAADDARAWIDRLAGLADLGEAQLADLSILAAVTDLHCAYASLLAIEGCGDAAVAVLRPIFSVIRQLFPVSRGYYSPSFTLYLEKSSAKSSP